MSDAPVRGREVPLLVCRSRRLFAAGLLAACSAAFAQPVASPWPVSGPDYASASAAAPLGGWYAIADSRADSIELRAVDQSLIQTLTRARIAALLPWMNFNTDADGPVALTFSDSGRLLFIAVADSLNASDGQAGDAILRYDTVTDDLRVFLRLELGGISTSALPRLVHHKGRLYVGYAATIRAYLAGRNDLAAAVITSTPFGVASAPIALAVDRETGSLLAGNGTQLSRAALGGASLVFSPLGTVPDGIRALAWADQYGGAGQGGLYVAHALPASSPPDAPLIGYVTPFMARAQQAFSPTTYLRGNSTLSDLSATADGALLASVAAGDALRISDTSDTRLNISQWAADEFAQVVRFGKGLISPDGEPAGWVIDGDVQLGWTRFHPATPDGAAWTVLLLLMNDHINGDPQTLPLVRTILNRYAGLSSTGPAPSRSADGIYHHWIDPVTGGVKPGWDPELATMSTMKIVLAATRAKAYYPNDSQIQAAAGAIICGVQNWDSYFQSGTSRMFLKAAQNGGPDFGSASNGWHEGVIFAEQAGAYGSGSGIVASDRWLDRAVWSGATFVSGRPVTSTGGSFIAAFVSLYPLLLIDEYRSEATWRTNVQNLYLSNAAWTDDNAPRFSTVFSAGTTRSDWGGYNADSLSNHPGDITTFPSLLAFCADAGGTPNPRAAAVAAYHAYRAGARQTFRTGASILYRRSEVDPGYQPNSAGLPDVALGALGLAEILSPGSVAQVLTGAYPRCGLCPSDWNEDGGIDGADVEAFFIDWEAGDADINADGGTDGSDVQTFFEFWEGGC